MIWATPKTVCCTGTNHRLYLARASNLKLKNMLSWIHLPPSVNIQKNEVKGLCAPLRTSGASSTVKETGIKKWTVECGKRKASATFRLLGKIWGNKKLSVKYNDVVLQQRFIIRPPVRLRSLEKVFFFFFFFFGNTSQAPFSTRSEPTDDIP